MYFPLESILTIILIAVNRYFIYKHKMNQWSISSIPPPPPYKDEILWVLLMPRKVNSPEGDFLNCDKAAAGD